MMSDEQQSRLLFPVFNSKSALDQSIRVVNAFRSGVERNPPPPALLRRAAQLKSQSLDAGSSSFPPSGSRQQPSRGHMSTSASMDEKQELKEKKLPKTATITDSNQSVETSV